MGLVGAAHSTTGLSIICRELRPLIAAIAINPYHHKVSQVKQDEITEHLSYCRSCRGYKGSQVRARIALGHDATHTII
jgi:hypothetical protein